MNQEIYDKYILAGKIASEARSYGAGLIKPGISYLQVAEEVEKKILDKNAGLAFPVNISINETAAHYTPYDEDEQVFKKGDLVKVDVGVHVDGYIADTAETVEVETSKHDEMIKASAAALGAAIDIMKAGVKLSKVGETIQETINSYGFESVDNLTGHSLERYNLHSGISVPNVGGSLSGDRPKEGDVLAVEPFATDGKGHVVAGESSNIFLCKKSFKSNFLRDRRTRFFYHKILRKFNTLPFSQRGCKKIFPNNTNIVLKKLTMAGLLRHYPQLVEQNKGFVSQKEHTMIIKKDGCEVTT